MHTAVNLVIDYAAMKLSSVQLGRYPRLVLLLLLLAAQGIANAHELGASHAPTADSCASCIIGHGLGAAVSVSPDAPQLEIGHALIANYPLTRAVPSRTFSHFARAPPAFL